MKHIQDDEISKAIKENGLFSRQQNILNSISSSEIKKSEDEIEILESDLEKSYPSSTHVILSFDQVNLFLEDLKKASEEEIIKGKKDFAKLQKKITIGKNGQRKVVYVKELEN